MAKPPRKQPERRKTSASPTRTGQAKPAAPKRKAAPPARKALVLRVAGGMLRLALRNPAVFGGSAAFAVIFGFVAANALWNQPGQHPSPFLRTRLPLNHPDPARITLREAEDKTEPGKVTTFVIEREAETASNDQPALAAPAADLPDDLPDRPLSQTAPTPERTASVTPRAAEPVQDDPAALIRSVQAELSRRGLYDGDADGRLGPKTVAAIRSFEQSLGREPTGRLGDGLLDALRRQRAPKASLAAATPAERPTGTAIAKGDLDAVAAAIRAADVDPDTIPKADVPSASGMVLKIQRGLTNLAYTDVTVDGVAGAQTRAAIRHFEKHYRLPETGEPSAAVLKKMQEIGAI